MEKTQITRAAVYRVLRDYWQQYRTYPVQTFLTFVLPAIATILTGFVPPLVIAKIVNLVAAGESLSVASVGLYVALFGGLWILGEILWRIGLHVMIKLESAGMQVLGKAALNMLTTRDYDFFTNNFVGSLTKKGSAYSRGFETVTETLFFNFLTNILSITFAVIVLWHYSIWLPALLVLSIAVTLFIGVPIIRRRAKLVALRHDAGSRVSGRISDVLTNILAVKSFAKEAEEGKTFGLVVDDYIAKYKKASDYHNLKFETVLSPLYVGANTIGLIAAIYFTQKLGLQAGTMVVVFTYYAQVTRTFWDINRIYRNLESSVSEAAEFTQLTLDVPAVEDAADAVSLKVSDSKIRFQTVGFGYGRDSKENLFLKEFNLDITGNQRVGLVGPSGGGKTTITKLLLRFIDPQSGSITIDGQDISKVYQRSLREAIAYVPQEPLLFHRSLFENIAYGNEKATRVEVENAAKLARADEFIEQLPKKYDTLVGERGIKLSGGQRQRVAIARAILKNAPILILDEATSSLDSESEKYIQEGLWELMKNKTALVIAHRLSTIKHLDRIIVLDEGQIVQDGTHEDLIKQKGLYAKLWSHQSGEFLED